MFIDPVGKSGDSDAYEVLCITSLRHIYSADITVDTWHGVYFLHQAQVRSVTLVVSLPVHYLHLFPTYFFGIDVPCIGHVIDRRHVWYNSYHKISIMKTEIKRIAH